MSTTTILTVPVQTRANGLVHTGNRQIPANFAAAIFTVNCTTGNPAGPFTGFADPFSDPNMAIEFGAQWSWDGGATWTDMTTGTVQGSPTGTWGTDRHTGAAIMAPSVGIGLPFDATKGGSPTNYRAGMLVAGGPITFGVTVQEVTT